MINKKLFNQNSILLCRIVADVLKSKIKRVVVKKFYYKFKLKK